MITHHKIKSTMKNHKIKSTMKNHKNTKPATPTKPTWDDIFKNKKWGTYPSEAVVREVKSLSVPPALTLAYALDLGCGAGSNAVFLAECGYHVTAIDASREALHQADGVCRLRGVSNRVRTLEADYLKLRDGPLYLPVDRCFGFRIILDWLSLTHQPKKKIAKEVPHWFRWLPQGGAYILGLFGDASSKSSFADVPMPSLFSLMEVRLMCKAAVVDTGMAFKVEESSYTRNGRRVQIWCVVFTRI